MKKYPRVTKNQVLKFIEESNLIENIHTVRQVEIDAANHFLNLDRIIISDLVEFVHVNAHGARLRNLPGMDVRVGGHIPMRGGPAVTAALLELLDLVNGDGTSDPFTIHALYETIHPFQDGNGRSGRILWAWQMLRDGHPFGLRLGFLHAWYYQSLEATQSD